MKTEFSKNSHRVEKLQNNGNAEYFEEYRGLAVDFDNLISLQIFDALENNKLRTRCMVIILKKRNPTCELH